jgi:site-specific recombinase XerD
MRIQHYSEGTKYLYRQSIRLFLEFLKDKSAAQVTHLDVRKFLLSLSENGVSLHSARKHLLSLRRFYDFLNLGGLVSYVAPRLVRVRIAPRRVAPHLSEQETRRLIAAAKTLREKALTEFFYGTGCRMTETRSLQIRDLDLNARVARVTGKFRKTRTVLLTQSAANALRDYIGSRETGYVFQQDYPSQKGVLTCGGGVWCGSWTEYSNGDRPNRIRRYFGRSDIVSREKAQAAFDQSRKNACLIRPKRNAPLTSTAIGTVLRKIASRAGLTRVTAHMLRHSFATHLYERGADLIAIQTLLGHAHIRTTADYAHASAFKVADVFERCHPLGLKHAQSSKPE